MGPSSERGLFAGKWSVSSNTSSMIGLGYSVMTSIVASSMLLKSILSKVVFTCIESMLTVLVFQSIFRLYCFSHGSPKIIFSFPSPVARNLVLIFFFPICILSHAQCSIVPVLFFVPSMLKAWIDFSIGIKAIPFCWANFLSMKVPPAPESISVKTH